jgi:hypothetical protein
MKLLLLAAALGFSQQMIDLNCMEGLVAVERANLAGVFSFIPAADTSHAFADLIAHDKKLVKKFAAKVDDDFKKAGAVTVWDHEVVMNLLSLLGSPLAATLDDPGAKVKERLSMLGLAPTGSLQDIALKRKLR